MHESSQTGARIRIPATERLLSSGKKEGRSPTPKRPAFIFLTYIFSISFIPDIKKVFQYHGAEHKSISTFEAGLDLTVENARKFETFHPRCGTTFIFFLMFVSIILFAIIFAIVPVGANSPVVLKHLYAYLTHVPLSNAITLT